MPAFTLSDIFFPESFYYSCYY